MKILIAMLFMILLVSIGQVMAQTPISSIVPSWVTTAAPEAGMLPPGSSVELTVYDAANAMHPSQISLMIGGYWQNADHQSLYYLYSPYNPSTFWLLNRATVPGG